MTVNDHKTTIDAKQFAEELDRLHQRIDRLQFWGDTTTRHLEKLAETLAEQDNE